MYCFLDVRKEGDDTPVLSKSGFYPNYLDFYPDDLDLDFTHHAILGFFPILLEPISSELLGL